MSGDTQDPAGPPAGEAAAPTPVLPAPQPPCWADIPPSMAGRQQWLLWRFEWKPGRPPVAGDKPLKMPYYVAGGRRSGKQGTEPDRQKLATLAVARRAFERGGWSGVGFAFLPDDGLIGIDLDKKRDPETGEWSEQAREIIAACNSFTEVSPSGNGVHIFVEGVTESHKDNGIGVEVFCGSQFFTVTGQRFAGTPAEVSAIDPKVLARLHLTIDKARRGERADAAADAPAAPRQFTQRSETPDQLRARVESALQAVQPDMGYTDWVSIGWALYQAFGEPAFSLWDAWSARGAKYAGEGDLRVHWRSFKKSRKSKPLEEAVAPIFAKARDAGWKPSRRERGAQPQAPARPRAAGPARDVRAPAGVAQAGEDGAAQPSPDLADLLVWKGGRPLDCRENVMYALQHDPQLAGLVRKNEFTGLLERSRPTPWARRGRDAGEWDEEDDLMLGEYLLRTYGLGLRAAQTIAHGVLLAATRNGYNPVIDLIRAERWDGTERLPYWLCDVYEVADRPYTRLIGPFFMMGLVKRALQPGCKFDYMLILKGEQGLSKSSTFRALAAPFFTDNAMRVGDKDSLMAQQLAWLVESAELESLNRAETTHIKQHLSAQEDWYRPPYGGKIVKAPRHSVHVGTTNADTFLKDATGDRRMWPLEVMAAHPEVLLGMRGQLLAEALVRVERGDRYWPTQEEERTLVFPEQEQFKRADPWEDMLAEYLAGDGKEADPLRAQRQFFSTTEIFKALDIKADRIDGLGNMDTRIGHAMKALGFKRDRETGGKRRRGFVRMEAPAAAPGQAATVPAAGADDTPF